MGGALFRQPWRTLPESQETLDFLKSYQPKNKQVTHVRILLHGPVGAGKSSFFNSVESVFQGRVTGRALTDAISGSSFTQNYTTYKIRKDSESFYSFIFNDIMGFEESDGIPEDDVKLALLGHEKEGYKFNPKSPMKKNDIGYNVCPTLDDRVHVLVCVVPVSSVSLLSDKILKKMRDVRLAASEIGIPQMAILTKVDEACPTVKNNIENVYKSKYLKEQNYSSEIKTNEATNAQILCALRQIIIFAEDFLDNLST